MTDSLVRCRRAGLNPALHRLLQIESERQFLVLILIPSESKAPMAVREATARAFQNVYTEGYPADQTRRQTWAVILDFEVQLAPRSAAGPSDS